MLRRYLLPLLVLATVPLLMAPPDSPCGVCHLYVQGALAEYQFEDHSFSVSAGADYWFVLDVSAGDATATIVSGPAQNLQCSGSDCTFDATGTGTVTLRVTAGGQGADYELYVYEQ